jgi:lysophospholipase
MDLFNLPSNPVPDGAICDQITTSDGLRLRYARWPAPAADCRGTVCIFHGRAEFIEKYFETIVELRQRGFAVVTLDWRGQGGSDRLLADRRKGHVRRFSEYDIDLECLLKQVVFPDCPAPYYALAHSTGANVLLNAAPRLRSRFDRVVVVAPMIRLSGLPLPHRLAGRLSRLFCLLGMGAFYLPGGDREPYSDRPFEDNWLTGDRRRYQRLQDICAAAPQLPIGAPTIGWFSAACRAMDRLLTYEYTMRAGAPVLMMVGARDRIVSRRAIEELSGRVKTAAHIVLPRARHEILFERDDVRELFWAAFDAYIPGGSPDATD